MISADKTSTVAKLFEDVQNLNTKDQADTQLLAFLNNDPQAGETLIAIIDQTGHSQLAKKSAAIQLKNFLQKKYSQVLAEKPPDEYTKQIFSKLVPFAFSEDRVIQDQSCTAIALIFDTLEDSQDESQSVLCQYMKELVAQAQKCISNTSIYGLMMVFTIFSGKYLKEMKSDEILIQILTIQSAFCHPFKSIFMHVMDQFQHVLNKDRNEVLKVMKIIQNFCAFLKAVNYYDMLEFFEDNLKDFIMRFIDILDCKIPNTHQYYNDITMVKIDMMDCINFFHRHYLDDIKEMKINFLEPVYKQLISSEAENPTYDILVSKYFQFMIIVASNNEVREFLTKAQVIEAICKDIIMPNINLGSGDESKFEECPDDFINEDLILMESASRRKACENFLKEFSTIYENESINFFLSQVQNGFSNYSAGGKTNWKECEKSIVILTAIATRGYSKKFGASSTPKAIDIPSIFKDTLMPLIRDKSTNPFIVAKCLKFVCIFRSLIPINLHMEIFPSILQLFMSESQSIIFYAGYSVDQLMSTIQQHLKTKSSADLAPIMTILPEALKHLLVKALSNSDDDEVFNSEILVKTAIHIFVVLGEKALEIIAQDFDEVIKLLVLKLKALGETPGKSMFMHRLYELLALFIRVSYSMSPETIALFEGYLFPVFEFFFTKDLLEAIPYALQMISLLIELQNGKEVNQSYVSLAAPLMQPQIWESSSNIYPIITLLKSLIYGMPQRLGSQFFEDTCGIVRRLIATRSLESQAISIINTISVVDREHLRSSGVVKEDLLKNLVQLILMKIRAKKTQRILESLAVTLSLIVLKESVDLTNKMLESIQPGLFHMVVEKLFAVGAETVRVKSDLKLVAAGIVNIIQYPSIQQNQPIAKKLTLVLGKLISNQNVNLLSAGDGGESLTNLLEEADSFDNVAAIGGLKFNKICFGANWMPFKAININDEIRKQARDYIQSMCNTHSDLKQTFEKEKLSFVDF